MKICFDLHVRYWPKAGMWFCGVAIASISNGPRSNVRAFANSAKLAASALERGLTHRVCGPIGFLEDNMIRIVAVAFILAAGATAYAMPRASIHQADSLVSTVREACGAGMHRVNGVCVRTAARRNAARCATGMKLVEGRCVR